MLVLKLMVTLPFFNEIKTESRHLFSKIIKHIHFFLALVFDCKCNYANCVELIWVNQRNQNHKFFIISLDRKLHWENIWSTSNLFKLIGITFKYFVILDASLPRIIRIRPLHNKLVK